MLPAARTHIQQTIRKQIGSSERSTVIIFGVAASLVSICTAIESNQNNVPGGKESKQTQPESIFNNQLPVFYRLLLPNRADCESNIFDRWARKGNAISNMDTARDKRQLESTYSVDWDSPLGEGGFGTVYLATDRNTREKVAMKKISKKFTDNESFQREMEALLAIRKAGGHPNLCGLRENFDEGEYFYLTLDFISGGEMFDHLINSGPYSEADAARLIREVTSALSFLHGIDIIHGDLKPENLMLSTTNRADSVVKVIDFGTAQVQDENDTATKSTAMGMTPAYCPPEVLKLGNVAFKRNPSMDMWAMGIILYIMLVGVHPFDPNGNASDELITHRVTNRQSPPLRGSRYTRHVSDSAIDLIEKLLSWDEKIRLTADNTLKHPWVQGITAKKSKIEDSDNKLSKLRQFKSRLEAKVFKDFISWSDAGDQTTDASRKTSLIERSFRNFDTTSKGFVTAKDVGKGLDEKLEGDEALSLTAFSNLLSENMQNFFFKKGDVVYNEGEDGNDMFFLNSGVVEVTTKEGFRTNLKAGDFVGEGALMSNEKRSGTVKCVTPVHAIKVTKKYFTKYLTASDPELNLKMLEKTKIRDTSRKMFSGFSKLLSQNMKNESFKKGQIIYNAGEEGNSMLFIKSGVVSVTFKDGFQRTLKQGDFVGEGALLNNGLRSGTVTCLTPVEGMSISKDYFEKYMASFGTALRLKMHQENKSRDMSRMQSILRQQKHLRPMKFSKGDLMYKEGDITKNLYIVVDGDVELEVGSLSTFRVKRGDFCGEHSLIFESPRNASARCVSNECNVIEIGPRAFRTILTPSLSLVDSLREVSRQREFQKAVVFHTQKGPPMTEKDLREMFNAAQQNKDGRTIMLEDIDRLLRHMNPKISTEEISEIFKSIDLGGNESVNYETFKVIFSHHQNLRAS